MFAYFFIKNVHISNEFFRHQTGNGLNTFTKNVLTLKTSMSYMHTEYFKYKALLMEGSAKHLPSFHSQYPGANSC